MYIMVLAIKTDLALRHRLLLCLVAKAPPSIVVLSLALHAVVPPSVALHLLPQHDKGTATQPGGVQFR